MLPGIARQRLAAKPEPPACACNECKGYCYRPCWPTPADARRLIDAGYGERLMLDWWVSSPDDVELLCPASPGCEGSRAPEVSMFDFFSGGDPFRGCVFQDGNGLCGLHAPNLKPTEGRLAHHTDDGSLNVHEAVAALWDTDEGRAVVAEWKSARFGKRRRG
jgi:hypothetical protein